MAVNLSPVAGAAQQFFSNNGVPLVGGFLYTYAAGTTTLLATYTSSSGATANSNPIVFNSAGRLDNEVWLTSGSTYKFVLKDASDVLIATYDNISGINDVNTSSFAPAAGSTSIVTLGTVTTGTWNATKIGVAYGGLNLTSIPALSIPVANTVNTYTTVTPAAGQSIRVNAGNTAWEAYTPIGPTPDVQTFDSTGTWTKPTGYTMARVQVWGGGGGGSRAASVNLATGGGGGGYNEITVPISYLAATVTATVASGGLGATTTASGAVGGQSSFALATAFMGRSSVDSYGGAGGVNSATSGGIGGGQLSAGTGLPSFGTNNTWLGGYGGSANSGCPTAAIGSLFGGGGGTYGAATAGVSLYGGNGGANAVGTQPAGGGGCATAANTNGSNGAAGRIVVTCW